MLWYTVENDKAKLYLASYSRVIVEFEQLKVLYYDS